MRDILSDLEAGKLLSDPDPTRRAQKQMKAPLPKRFYKQATVGEGPDGFSVLLDGKRVRTPARKMLAAPSRAVAEALAAEFEAQAEHIDPATMPLLRLVNTALDGIAGNEQAIVEDMQRFASSDLLCYRADGPRGLVERQTEHWDPVLDWARSALGARFVLAEGVMHVEQPREAIAAIGIHVATLSATGTGVPQNAAPLALAALHTVTTLTGSALLALALARSFLEADAVWSAAHIDEDWNVEQWGEDAEAKARRAYREREFRAAALILQQMPD